MNQDMNTSMRVLHVLLALLLSGVLAFFVLLMMPIYGTTTTFLVTFTHSPAESVAGQIVENMVIVAENVVQKTATGRASTITRLGDSSVLRITTWTTTSPHTTKAHARLIAQTRQAIAAYYSPANGVTVDTLGTTEQSMRSTVVALVIIVSVFVGTFLASVIVRRIGNQIDIDEPRTRKRYTRSESVERPRTKMREGNVPQIPATRNWQRTHRTWFENTKKPVDKEAVEKTEAPPAQKTQPHATIASDLSDTSRGEDAAGQGPIAMPTLPDVDNAPSQKQETTVPTETVSPEEDVVAETSVPQKTPVQKPTVTAAGAHGAAPGNLPVLDASAFGTPMATTDNNSASSQGDVKDDVVQAVMDLPEENTDDEREPTDEELKERLNQLLHGNL